MLNLKSLWEFDISEHPNQSILVYKRKHEGIDKFHSNSNKNLDGGLKEAFFKFFYYFIFILNGNKQM